MRNYFTALSFVILLTFLVKAESIAQQIVRGKVVDKETQVELPGASIMIISDTTNLIGSASDLNGNFRLENVPYGKHTLKISFISYENVILDITVTSAKEVVLKIELEESSTALQEFELVAIQRGEVINEMAIISARTFDVSETERYAGSRGDPARMASNFAGVQGADDSRNDIVVRGNSPLGVLYKMEGFDLPNPNHFSIAGSSGGPVSILNNKVLANSDFFTSAFPAEYGNSSSAVFDLRLRNGNNENHEFSAQLGFLGTELAAEGPINKTKGSSYLAVYRYSTLSLFGAMGINIGTSAIPRYQDASFKLNFPAGKKGNFSIFGIGGSSAIDIVLSEQTTPAEEFYGDDDRDQYFQTRMGMFGFNYSKSIKDKTFFRTGIAVAHEKQSAQHDYFQRHLGADSSLVLDTLYPLMRYKFTVNKYSYILSFNTKLSKNHVLKYGINAHLIQFNMIDSALNQSHSQFDNRWDYTGMGMLAQAYVQYKWKPNEKVIFTAGMFSQYFSVSNSFSPAEPRLAFRYSPNKKQAINIGVGLHSQTQPMYTYFYHFNDTSGNKLEPHNKNIDLTKSFHSVIGYDLAINPTTRIKIETYYQYLFNVPVEVKSSAFSLTNMGSGFARFFPDTLQNTGTGRNYGVELTVEKFFTKSFFFLFTASVFDAKYRGSDDTLRNTDYNGKYAANLLIGKEFKTGKKSTLGLGTKFTTAGGRWYGYADTAASNASNELIYKNEGYNSRQFRPYYRLDFKINFKINAKKVTHEIAVDLVNILGIENILNLSYAPNPFDASVDPIRETYQLGFLPLFYYRIDF